MSADDIKYLVLHCSASRCNQDYSVELLRSKVGGPSKVYAILCGMGPPYYSLLIGTALLQLAD